MRTHAYLAAAILLIATLLVNFSDARSLYKRVDTQATDDVALPQDAASLNTSSRQLDSGETLDKLQKSDSERENDNDYSVYEDIESDGTQDDVDPQWIKKVEMQQQKDSRIKKRDFGKKGDLFYFKFGGSMYDLDMYDESDVFYDESYYDFF